jgi:hypothetical protein
MLHEDMKTEMGPEEFIFTTVKTSTVQNGVRDKIMPPPRCP